jgi:hypothetical protein
VSSLGVATKARLAARVWSSFALVHWRLRREPLPAAIGTTGDGPAASWAPMPPLRLSRTVHMVLRVGPWRPRCLINAMVLYRLLRAQGTDADLVIGLPDRPEDHEAHAWVEVDGHDVGPPPGKGSHEELARYPA